MRRLIMAVALTATASFASAAQRLGPPMERPHLRDVTDTNDARAYYDFGLATVDRDPEQAAAAFYWAARINPMWGDPLYARRAALLMRDRSLLVRFYESGRRDKVSPELRRLDSLQFRALMLSPFLYRRLDQTMFMAYIRESARRNTRMSGGDEPSRTELEYYIEQYLRNAGPWMRGWVAYGRGEFGVALSQYALATSTSRDKSTVPLERGRIFAMMGSADSAVSQLNVALAEMRKRDEKDLVVFYDSKALAEFSVAVLLEGAGDRDGAREAFGRALQEDLSFYPAHMRLGLLALGTGDTTTAISELAMASQLAADEPMVRYTHGYVLLASRHYADAVAELRKATELEPYFALPYLRLGQAFEQLQNGPDAVNAYQAFLARSSQTDLQRDYATGRLTEVQEILASPIKP